MRVAGELKLDGDKIVLQQGGNATTITSNTPASDITLTLPATTDSLVGRATTDTLTNKTLTSPKINEDVVLTATATELNQLDGVTVGGTAAGDIVSIDGDQTLTGKTIVAADNTITTAASGNLASTELNAALAELQGSIDVRVLTTDFNAHVNDFDTHTGALAAHGASGAVVGTNNTQTLLNKTLTNPKINDTIALTATSTELNYVKNVTSAIQTQLDAKASTATLTSHTSATSAHGVTGNLVGTSDTQTLTNKTLTDPTIDAALVLAELASSPAAPAAGFKKIYAKDDGKLYTLDSDDVEQEVGSGASSGSGINYLSANPSAATNTTGWSATGTMTIERIDADHADAANRPRANTTGTCFKASGGAAGDYASADFTLDEADERAANLLAKLAAKVADASTWKVQLWAYSDSARTLDETEITLVDADSSGDWFLAATTADFTTFWTPNPSLPYMQLRIVDTVGGNTIYWSDTLVGPGDATSGAVITPWTDVPITDLLAGTPGNNTVTKCAWRQVGESVEYYVVFAGDGTGSGNVQFQLHDTTLTPALSDGDNLELGRLIDETNSTGINSSLTGTWNSSTKKFTVVRVEASRSATLTYPSFTSVRTIVFHFSVPITDWVRSGTVGLGTNRVEYWSHDGTSVVRGRDGALVPTTTPAGSTDDYSLTGLADSAAARGAIPRLEMLLGDGSGGTVGTWVPVPNNYIEDLWTDSTNVYGAGLTTGSEVGLRRGKYRRGNSTSWATLPSGTRWRVVVTAPGVVTGFGQATADTYGLLKKSKWQAKTASSVTPVTATEIISFNNLVVGNTYRIFARGNVNDNNATGTCSATIELSHNSTILDTVSVGGDRSAAGVDYGTYVIDYIFTAEATTVTIQGTDVSGDPRLRNNYARLEERHDIEETTDFT